MFDPPDTDKWAPLLDDLNFRSGDHFDVSRSARPLNENEAALTIKEADVALQTMTSELEALGERRDRVIAQWTINSTDNSDRQWNKMVAWLLLAANCPYWQPTSKMTCPKQQGINAQQRS